MARPPTNRGRGSPRVTIRLSLSEDGLLRTLAQENDMSPSAYVYAVLYGHLEDQRFKREKRPQAPEKIGG